MNLINNLKPVLLSDINVKFVFIYVGLFHFDKLHYKLYVNLFVCCAMSANEGENSNNINLLINFERQFRQLLLESKSNEVCIEK